MGNTQFIPIKLDEKVKNEDALETKQLISQLEKLATEKPKRGAVKKFQNTVIDSDQVITSWRFNEWDYSSRKVTLPTYSRGLFTAGDEIVCRGYNKFYNVNEFQEMSEENLRTNTKGPYTITVKSNGCIVFISGLADGTLVVCSKHSTGKRNDIQKNHAMAAQRALEAQLDKVGMTKLDLAQTLYDSKLTAVAEFCDDNFEEHVLEYRGNRAGLYLHGLNFNTAKFRTYPMELVNAFGNRFGFKRTEFIRKDTFDETVSYLKDVTRTGLFEGQQVEGFVVRCFNRADDIDFFFKYKFEEPYLLYRELREVTKQYIRGGMENVHFGKHKLICMDYLKFIIPYLHENPDIKDRYLENKGVIELRKKYFNSKGRTDEQVLRKEVSVNELANEVRMLKFGSTTPCKYVLVTVATIGCGKTTTSLMLSYLYPDLIGHVQNDNIQRPVSDKLTSKGLEILINKPIVILDKNNHMIREREKLFSDFERLNEVIPISKLKFVCLNFVKNSPRGDKHLWDLTTSRIVDRGDNHQSIKAKSGGIVKAEKIMGGFIGRFQQVDPHNSTDSKFDLIVDLDVTTEDSSLKNTKTIVNKLRTFATDLNLKEPTDKEYKEAYEKALLYHPSITKVIHSNKEPTTPKYFGIEILDSSEIYAQVEKLIQKNVFACASYLKLKSNARLSDKLHVTMIHKKSRKTSTRNRNLWGKYRRTFTRDLGEIDKLKGKRKGQFRFPSGAYADVRIVAFCCDSQLACLKVEVTKLCWGDGKPIDLPSGNKFPHITLGTISDSVAFVASNDLLNKIYEFGATDGVEIINFPQSEETILKNMPLFASYY